MYLDLPSNLRPFHLQQNIPSILNEAISNFRITNKRSLYTLFSQPSVVVRDH